jgi:predicted kinase
MSKPKLIVLYGFAASGKTTISKKYIEDHPLALSIEGDQIISMMGQWRVNEEEAREIVFTHTLEMAKVHLKEGYDVLLPYLLTDPEHASIFETTAKDLVADFYEVYIEIEQDEAIDRLLERGVWGEEGSPHLTDEDSPEINSLYNTMKKALEKRSAIKVIKGMKDDTDGTYSGFLNSIT